MWVRLEGCKTQLAKAPAGIREDRRWAVTNLHMQGCVPNAVYEIQMKGAFQDFKALPISNLGCFEAGKCWNQAILLVGRDALGFGVQQTHFRELCSQQAPEVADSSAFRGRREVENLRG